jgi:hypothetical protein
MSWANLRHKCGVCLEGLRKTKNFSVIVIDFPADIRTEHFLNASLLLFQPIFSVC